MAAAGTTAAALLGGSIALAVAAPASAATAGQAQTATVAAQQQLLREGSRGPAVSAWQSTLNKLAAKGTPSQAKVATKAATQAFQKWAHIDADGVVGPQTQGVAATTLSSAALDPNPHVKPVLHHGSQGAAVSDWQSTLNKLAAKGTPSQAKVAVDGIFGPATKAATQAFQKWAHIDADGIVGPQTYTAAARALG